MSERESGQKMEGNNNEGDKEEKPSRSVRFRTKMHDAGHFAYNSDTKEVLGRSGMSWLKILSFYIVFYAILAGFWATCMVVFIKTLDPVAPTMQKMFSMMKDNPGMNYEPFTDQAKKDSKNLISYNVSANNTHSDNVLRLNKVYAEFLDLSRVTDPKPKECSYGNGATVNEACRFDMAALGSSCTPEEDFGYSIGMPCVLLRINRVFLWEPNNVTFDREDKCKNTTEDKAKEECKKHLEFKALPETIRSDFEPGFIGVSCEGENDASKKSLKNVTFYPPGGFPAYFYPYYNQQSYMPPLVMAQFNVTPGVVSILCKVWTRDIIHDRNDLQGSIHFDLSITT